MTDTSRNTSIVDAERKSAHPSATPSVFARRRRQAIGASVGNFLEFYNFILYAFFTPMIARTFFRAHDPLIELVYTLLTFASGYLVRPLGAIILGIHARRFGAGKTLSLTFLLMGLGSLLVAITPGYEAIGPSGTILLVAARLLQGFAEGGDVGPSTDLLLVLAEGTKRKTLYILMQPATQYLASFVGVFIGFVMSVLMPEAALYSWGWRLPFLLGVIIIPIGFWARRTIVKDAIAISAPNLSEVPPSETVALNRLAAICMFGFVATGAIQTYIRNFGVSYAVGILHLSPKIATGGMCVGLLSGVFGMVCGIRVHTPSRATRMIVVSGVIQFLTLFPSYYYATHDAGVLSQCLLNIVWFLPSGCAAAAVWTIILPALPVADRSFIYGVVYTLAVCIFGGLTQPVIAWLIARTGDTLVPAYIGMVTIPLGLWAVLHLQSRASRLQLSTA